MGAKASLLQRTIFVKNLNFQTDEDHLREVIPIELYQNQILLLLTKRYYCY